MNFCIPIGDLKAALLALPEMAGWPDVVEIFSAKAEKIRMDWQLPVVACQAVGGDPSIMTPAAAATACLQCSIILVDDLLDEDPRGAHHRLGAGRAANLGLAFQTAAVALIDAMPVDLGRRTAAMASVARAGLATAWGQELDVQNVQGEANYWRVLEAKATPFYGVGLKLGAMLAGAEPAVTQGLYDVGSALGRIIQLRDDLSDALASPANTDWTEGRNNIVLLYALVTDHKDRARFAELRGQAADPAALKDAQHILITSGAASYAVYLIVKQYQAALALVRSLPLADPAPILTILGQQMEPLVHWLRDLGLPVPPDLSPALSGIG